MKRAIFWMVMIILVAFGLGGLIFACSSDDNGDGDKNGKEGESDDDNDDVATDDDDNDDDNDAGTTPDDTGGGNGVKCEDPSLLPPTCLPKGKERPGDVVKNLKCSQREELYSEEPCTYLSCEIYDSIYNAIYACAHTTPDPDMCNCLDCYYKQMACMVWQDEFQKCDDAEEIKETCAKDRDVCMQSFTAGKCEMIEGYIVEVTEGALCFNKGACAVEVETGVKCICVDDKWNCGADVVCGE